MSIPRGRPSPSFVLAAIALFVALSGAAIALPGKNTVDSGDIRKNAVKSSDIAKGAVRSADIRNGQVAGSDLGANSVNGGKIAANSVNSSDVAGESLSDADISDFQALGTVRVVATEAANEAAAQAAAPEVVLFSKGPLTFYAKCFRHTDTNVLHGEIYARTTQAGSIMQGTDNLDGDPAFLDPGTLEEDREFDEHSTANNVATIAESEAVAAAPDGTTLFYDTWIAAKNGVVAGGNGIYGAGNVCLFGGQITG